MKRLFTAVSIALVFLGCSNPQTQLESDIEVPVSVEEITPKHIEEFVTSTGNVNAIKDYLVKSETTGFYRLAINPETGKKFTLGDLVKKDQVIIYLDNPEQINSIKLESIELNLDITKRMFDQQQSLYDKGGVTLSELKNAERSYIDAKYSYDNALIQLSKMKITAPFNGIIVDIPYYTEGVKVASGSDMLRVMDYSELTMDIQIPGLLLGQITVGQPVRVSNYTISDKTLPGSITQVSPALAEDTRAFKATIDIDNPELILRPGMFVKAEIITAQKDSAIVIPKDIIMVRRNTKSVYVVDNGYARERRISQGLENPDETEVTEGLAQGEQLVINGYETLRNGSKVKIVR